MLTTMAGLKTLTLLLLSAGGLALPAGVGSSCAGPQSSSSSPSLISSPLGRGSSNNSTNTTSTTSTPNSTTSSGSSPPSSSPSSSSPSTIPQGFSTILFLDDFSTQQAGAPPNASKWKIDTGTQYPGGAVRWGTNEVQTYTASTANLAITSRGTLQITPVKQGAGAAAAWTSARIETTAEQDFSCPAGGKIRMEARLKIGGSSGSSSSSPNSNSTVAGTNATAAPALQGRRLDERAGELAQAQQASQLGIWPAFWSLGSAYRSNVSAWPASGEIDVLETLNGQAVVYQTAHCGVADGGPCKETTGLSSKAALPRGTFTTLACEVDRTNGGQNATGTATAANSSSSSFEGEKLVWSVDGKVTKTLTGSDVGDAQAWEALAQTPKMLLLNVAVGGVFPDAVAGFTTPGDETVGGQASAMEVQYVAVYST